MRTVHEKEWSLPCSSGRELSRDCIQHHPRILPNTLPIVLLSRRLLFSSRDLGEPQILTLGLSRRPLRQWFRTLRTLIRGTLKMTDGLTRALYYMVATAFGMGVLTSPLTPNAPHA